MRLGSFAFMALVGVGGVALADSGDTLRVTGQGVNVRSGPSTSNRIVLQVNRNREAIELERQGDWVRVEVTGTGGREGWIHSSLLEVAAPAAPASNAQSSADARPATAPKEPAAGEPEIAERASEPNGSGGPVPSVANAPEPAAGPRTAALSGSVGGVERFRENVDYLNKRARQVAGVNLFTEVSMIDGGVVQIGTTDAWGNVPPAGQRSYLNTLYDRWVAAQDGSSQVSVQILDESGSVMMEKSAP